MYASPEQRNSGIYSYETDHYSAGLVILELLHPSSTTMQKVQVIREARNGELPQSFLTKYPKLGEGIKGLLSLDIECRPSLQTILRLIECEELALKRTSHRFSSSIQLHSQGSVLERKAVIHGWLVLIIDEGRGGEKAESHLDLRLFDLHFQGKALELKSALLENVVFEFPSSSELRRFQEDLSAEGHLNQTLAGHSK